MMMLRPCRIHRPTRPGPRRHRSAPAPASKAGACFWAASWRSPGRTWLVLDRRPASPSSGVAAGHLDEILGAIELAVLGFRLSLETQRVARGAASPPPMLAPSGPPSTPPSAVPASGSALLAPLRRLPTAWPTGERTTWPRALPARLIRSPRNWIEFVLVGNFKHFAGKFHHLGFTEDLSFSTPTRFPLAIRTVPPRRLRFRCRTHRIEGRHCSWR